ncbi:hypothetical protein NE237_007982 [Protea cynaroides]|uniref:Uncharacterized protein n=1 Tax=Protea cynaroides TaxID=273540 RepID=A0A9Q0KQ49_9MAGN|nr:hypothetical protein NE237_007982 [Protea cynaroides]
MAMIPGDTSGIPVAGVPFGSSSSLTVSAMAIPRPSSTRDTAVTPSSVPMELSKTGMTRDPNGLGLQNLTTQNDTWLLGGRVSSLLVKSMKTVQPDLSLMQRIPTVVGGGVLQQGGALMMTEMRKIRESKFTGCRNRADLEGKKHRSGAPVFLIHSVLTDCIPYLDFNDFITNLDIPISKFNSDSRL